MTNPGFMASQAAQQASQANWAAQQAAQQASQNAIRSAQLAHENSRRMALAAGEHSRLAAARAQGGRPASGGGILARLIGFLIGLTVLAGVVIVGWLVLGGDPHALRAILNWLRRTF
ncbi:MAG: hypothetical protein QM711_15200 [Micropruina sp.]|uniref:hypothetical protein n=1 Tax=Micropruina sp. TaxID=2737536 RepID=UPI0039E4F0AB